MTKKLLILGLLLALFVIEFPVEGFAGNSRILPASVESKEGTETATASQPRRKRRGRRAWRNGRWVWVS